MSFRMRLEVGNRPRKEVVQLKKPVQNYKPKSIHASQVSRTSYCVCMTIISTLCKQHANMRVSITLK